MPIHQNLNAIYSHGEILFMTEDRKNQDTAGFDRRDFLVAGAGGLAAAGLTAGTASAKTYVPGEELPTNSTTGRRVAIVNDALIQIGPPLARGFAKQGYNLVIAQPAEGLVAELESLGSKVVVVEGIEQEGPNDESQPGSTQKLVDAAMKNFGGFDSAFIRTARHMAGGILDITPEDMQALYESNFLAVIYSLQSLLPPLMEKGAGQIVILTSASGDKPLYDFLGYSSMRAAANTAIQCAAMTAAPKGVCVNAFGTNFLNYPDAVNAFGGPEGMETVAKNIPAGRFGEPEEMAHLAMALLDGRNMYTTGQAFMIAGGYNVKLDSGKFV
jgi:3-oxoacyl-[acyl-carrier protein] reductase